MDLGWQYPPGVSEKKISHNEPETCVECQGEGKLKVTPCCQAAFVEDSHHYHCAECQQAYAWRTCAACDGEGVIWE